MKQFFVLWPVIYVVVENYFDVLRRFRRQSWHDTCEWNQIKCFETIEDHSPTDTRVNSRTVATLHVQKMSVDKIAFVWRTFDHTAFLGVMQPTIEKESVHIALPHTGLAQSCRGRWRPVKVERHAVGTAFKEGQPNLWHLPIRLWL